MVLVWEFNWINYVCKLLVFKFMIKVVLSVLNLNIYILNCPPGKTSAANMVGEGEVVV